MKVLIINTNQERSPQTLIPLGACMVAAAARSAGHEVRFADLTFGRYPDKAVEDIVKAFQPGVIGLSIRNIDNCDFIQPQYYLPEIKSIVEVCRKAGVDRLVIGGPAVSCLPEQMLRYLKADLAVVGEGEKVFPSLLKVLETGCDPCLIPGVAALHEGEFIFSPPQPAGDFSSSTHYPLEQWIDIRRYKRYDSSMPVLTKRGCPFNCSYCLYPRIEGDGVRLREPELAAESVEEAAVIGLRSAEFVDSVFNVPESHAVQCCESIAHLKKRVPLYSLEFNPSSCSDDLVLAMRAAGFSAIGCTAESGSDEMLSVLGKGFTSDDIRRTAQKLQKLDIQKLWIFMVGGPGETEKTVCETGKFMKEFLTERDLVYVSRGIRIFPQTGLREMAVSEGVITPDNDLLEPMFYFSPHITPGRAMSILANSGFPQTNILSATDGNNRFLPLAQSAAKFLGVSPPYWQMAPLWNTVRQTFHMRRHKC